MTAERQQRAKEVFLAARATAPVERAARLRELCGGDEELWSEVVSLLEYDGRRGLERPAVETVNCSPDASDGALGGTRIGQFALIRALGHGGMGAVYEAEQDHPRRRVAVKLLRAGLTSPDALRRFEHEVELLGRLQHPGIAQVYAAGTFERGGERVPYFAMELVAGAQTLDAFVRGAALPLRERLRLFAAVCDAVHHGHQRGVIHRDLKPANILVDASGAPKVIDFGVARATDADVARATQQTQGRELVGTIAYMSPEQCDADPGGLDSRTDVYSLGVVLYELVCGRLPYDLGDRSITAAALAIREQEPEPPGRVDRRLRGDLEAVVQKCLEKDPQRRYSSAAELADDLRRYLAGDPVEARRPGPWRKAVRWIGRHPILTSACASALLLFVSISSLFAGSALADLPWRMQIDGAAEEAVLLSFSDQILKRWRAPEGLWITFAELIERPAELGGGRIVAIALDFQPRSGELCLFEVSDLETPYWTSASVPLRLPADEPDRPGTRFVIQTALVADLFAEVPGDELVVLHRLVPYSATALRVYDLSGALHYEAWHDGGVGSLHWLARHGVLVTAGLNSESAWSELGVDTGTSHAVYPAVVLALRPELGRTDARTFVAHRGSALDPTLLWYKWLGPREHVAALDGAVATALAPGAGWSADEHTQVLIRPGAESRLQPAPDFSLILDAHGNEVGRIETDTYRRWEESGDLPPASTYRLYDFAELPGR